MLLEKKKVRLRHKKSVGSQWAAAEVTYLSYAFALGLHKCRTKILGLLCTLRISGLPEMLQRLEYALIHLLRAGANVEGGAMEGTIKVFVFQNLLRNPLNIFVREVISLIEIVEKLCNVGFSFLECLCNRICWCQVSHCDRTVSNVQLFPNAPSSTLLDRRKSCSL